MKTTRALKPIIPLALAFALGCGFHQITAQPITARADGPGSTAPRLTFDSCTTNGVGSGPCAQYVLQVNSSRGFGRFQLLAVTGQPIDPAMLQPLAAGNPVLTLQQNEPAPREAQTFTIDVRE